MAWKQLTFRVRKEFLEESEYQLLHLGALSVTLLDAEDNPIFEPPPGEAPTWDVNLLVALFDDDINEINIIDTFKDDQNLIFIQFETIEDSDWERAWMDDFHPMKFGTRLWVCPKNMPPPQPDEVNILLDPGLAFGTGTHPTTALCLEWLDSIDLNKKNIIDYGCGSGILAIAALLLGAKHCYAINNDPQALTATFDNATENRVEERIEICLPEELPQTTADIFIANILAKPLVELAGKFASLCKQGTQIAVSGILEEQEQDIINAYKPHFGELVTQQKGDWLIIHGIKT